MNLPNKLSLLRVALIPVMVALMLPQTLVCDLLAAAVFAVAALTDYFDGHIARSRHLITDFGKFIDPVADKLLNLSAMMMLVQRGTLPGWVVVLILARELAVDGLRMVAVGQGAFRPEAVFPVGAFQVIPQVVYQVGVDLHQQGECEAEYRGQEDEPAVRRRKAAAQHHRDGGSGQSLGTCRKQPCPQGIGAYLFCSHRFGLWARGYPGFTTRWVPAPRCGGIRWRARNGGSRRTRGRPTAARDARP